MFFNAILEAQKGAKKRQTFILDKARDDTNAVSIWPLDGSEALIFAAPMALTITGVWIKNNNRQAIAATNDYAELSVKVWNPAHSTNVNELVKTIDMAPDGSVALAPWQLLDLNGLGAVGPFPQAIISAGSLVTFQQTKQGDGVRMGPYQILVEVTR